MPDDDDDSTTRVPDPTIRHLDGLEVSLRGFDANLRRCMPILERLQRDHAELVADLFGELEAFDPAATLKALSAVKAAVERAQR